VALSDDEVRNRSVGELIGEISKDLDQLVHQEIELAKAELKQEASKVGKGAGMLGGAGFAGYMVALFASLTLAYGIGTFWPTWVGALIVALIWGAAGAVLYTRGRQRLASVSGPTQTKEPSRRMRHGYDTRPAEGPDRGHPGRHDAQRRRSGRQGQPSAIAGRQLDNVRGAVSGVKDMVMGAAHTGGSSVSERAGSVGDALSGTPETVRAKAQGNPLAAGLIAFAAGLLVSSLLPSSEPEQHAAVALKEKAEPLTSQLAEEGKSAGQQLKEALQPAAQDAVAQVKSTAGDAVAATKEHATAAATEVADHAKGAATDTKDDLADHAAAVKEQAGS
jgi:gas vesicle protein